MTQKRRIYSPPLLIGLAGSHGVGKTTLAKTVVDRYENFTRMAFADPLREEGMAYFNAERIKDPVISRWLNSIGERPFAHEHKDTPIPGLGVTPRDILIEIGQGRRQQDPDYWIDRLFDRVRDTHRHVIVDDVYQVNEARAIVAAGGALVWISREIPETFSYPEQAEKIMHQYSQGWHTNQGRIEDVAAKLLSHIPKTMRYC